MTVSTDFYIATEPQASEAFSWINVEPIGIEPSGDFPRGDFEAFEKYSEAYEAWRSSQRVPRPDDSARDAMARLVCLQSKFVLAEKLDALRKMFADCDAHTSLHSVLHSPGHDYTLERLDPSFVEAMARVRPASDEANISARLAALGDDWLATGDPAEFVHELRAHCGRASAEGSHVFLFTVGDG